VELTLGVQPPPPPPPPPPVETLPPHPVNAEKKGAAKKAEIESERIMRGSFTVVFPILFRSALAGCRLQRFRSYCVPKP